MRDVGIPVPGQAAPLAATQQVLTHASQLTQSNDNYAKTVAQGAATFAAVAAVGCQLASCDADTAIAVTVLAGVTGAGVGDYVAKRNKQYATKQEAARKELELATQRRVEAEKAIKVTDDLIEFYERSIPIYRKQLKDRRILQAQYNANIEDLIQSRMEFDKLIELENVHLAILTSVRDDLQKSTTEQDKRYYAALDTEIAAANARIAEENGRKTKLAALAKQAGAA